MRPRNRAIGLVLGAALAFPACYGGDGDFQREGTWPLTSYSLDLEPFALEPGKTTRFRLRGWRSNKHTLVELTVTSPTPMAFDQADVAVAVVIKDRRGEAVFAPEPELSAHLKRMQAAGDALWPENEWECRHEWPDENVMKRAVPFVPGEPPRPQTQLECWDLIELPDSHYDIEVRCVTSPSTPALQGKLSLASGWK